MWIRSRGQSLWLASFPASWGAWICCQACPRIQSLRWWKEKQWNTFLFNSQCRIRTTVLFFFKHFWLRVELVEFHCNHMAASFVSGPIASFLASIQFVSWCACCPAKRLEFCWRVGGTASQQLRFKAFAAQPRLAIVTKTLALAANDLTHFGIVSWNESCRKMWLVFSVVEPEGKIAKNPRGCFFHFFLILFWLMAWLTISSLVCQRVSQAQSFSNISPGLPINLLYLCCDGNGIFWKRSGILCILWSCLPRVAGSLASCLIQRDAGYASKFKVQHGLYYDITWHNYAITQLVVDRYIKYSYMLFLAILSLKWIYLSSYSSPWTLFRCSFSSLTDSVKDGRVQCRGNGAQRTAGFLADLNELCILRAEWNLSTRQCTYTVSYINMYIYAHNISIQITWTI